MLNDPAKPEIQPVLMTINETATFLHISRANAYRLIAEQGLPTYRLGGSVRTRREDIEAWLKEQKAE